MAGVRQSFLTNISLLFLSVRMIVYSPCPIFLLSVTFSSITGVQKFPALLRKEMESKGGGEDDVRFQWKG